MSQLKIADILHSHQSIKILRTPRKKDIIPCLLMFLASRASVLGLMPFGVAMFAAAFDKSLGYIGVTVMTLGIMSAGEGSMLLKYCLAAVLYWLYTRIREDYREWTTLSSIVCGCSIFVGGCVLMIYSQSGTYDFLMLAAESVLAAFLYIVFDKGADLFRSGRKKPSDQDLISAALCCGIFITGMSGVYLPLGINISRVITSYAIMCIAMHEGLAVSGAGGLAAGLVCSMNHMSAITLMGVYGLAALFANLLKPFGKYGVGLGFLGGVAVTLLYIGDSFAIPLSISESVLAVLCFAATPMKLHNLIGSFFLKTLHKEIVPADVRMREYVHAALVKSASAFQSLNRVFVAVSEKRLKLYKRDACTILDSVSERICAGCERYRSCWQDSFHNTYRLTFSFLELMETEGKCTEENIPIDFRVQCPYHMNFIAEFNHMYELFKYQAIQEGEAIANRDMVAAQYEEFAKIMQSIADTVDEGFHFLETEELKAEEVLEKAGITVRSISIVEGRDGDLEIYLGINEKTELSVLEEKLTGVLNSPVGYECTLSGGLLKFSSKGIFQTETAVRQLPKEGFSVCGDNVLHFRTRDHKYYVMICDGMGSGKAAERESYMAGTLLEEFLRAGFGASAAINLINSSLALRLDREAFSSIDLLCLDLLTGQADFYKIGGNKSFVIRAEQVDTIFSESLPVGMLPDVTVRGISKRLEQEDIIVMLSDGVSDSGFGVLTGERLRRMLRPEESTAEEMASVILKNALRHRHGGAGDDMTAVVIRLKKVLY